MRFLLVRIAAPAAAAICAGTLLFHGWHAVRTACYVDLVTGVWLTLADDLRHGVFYRPLMGAHGYGGTRYFPLFFMSIAAPMRLGVDALAAGFAVSLAAGAFLVAGVRRCLADLRLPPALAIAGAIFVLIPPFTQQALFAIRSDLLAAGFVIWGAVYAGQLFEGSTSRARPLCGAALCFVLAAATKVTSLYGPGALVLALLLARRPGPAIRLALLVAAGTGLMIVGVNVASGGEAIESWRTCASAGASAREWMLNVPSAFLLEVILPSRIFTLVLACAVVAWIALVRMRGAPRAGRPAPASLATACVVLLPLALAGTAVIVASPGAIYTNQLIDAFAISVVVIGALVAARPQWQPAVAGALVVLSLWSGYRTLRPLLAGDRAQRDRQQWAERSDLIRSLAASDGPIFSESPELAVLAGVRPYLVDPFALRVVTLRRPDVLKDVLEKLGAQHFSEVLLDYDPETARGRGFYTSLDLGWPVVSSILANYERVSVQGGIQVYRPRPRGVPDPGLAGPSGRSVGSRLAVGGID